jgi:hypothetical protein
VLGRTARPTLKTDSIDIDTFVAALAVAPEAGMPAPGAAGAG